MSTVERLEAYCKQREREIDSETCEQALCVDERAAILVHELRELLDTIAAFRSATRVRVTAEETPHPASDEPVLAWDSYGPINGWCVRSKLTVIVNKSFTHWLPLPERPAK